MIEAIQVEQKIDRRRTKPQRRWKRSLLFLLSGMVFGVMAAYLISHGNWLMAVAAIIALPLIVYLNAHPFSGVLIWLLVMPFVSALPGADLVYWVIYRILPPFLLILAILSRIFKAREHAPARLGAPELAMGILALVVPGSILLFQADPNQALIRFADRMLLPFCMYFVVRLTAPRSKEFTQLQWVAFFIAFSQSVIGFLSWTAPGVLPHVWHYLIGERTTGSVKDPDLYAFLLIFSAILLAHAAANTKSGWVRWFLFLATGACAIFAFLSLERAAWLGEVLVFIGLVILHPKMMLRFLIVGGVVMAFLGAEIVSTNLDSYVSRFSESDPVYDRLVVFDAMSQMFQMKPALGWGYETLDQNIQHFYRRAGEAYIASRLVTSHNTYMTVLTELGLAGFILYLFPVAWWFILSIRVWARVPKEGLWSRPLLASLWLMMIFNFTVSNFIDMRWFEMGVALWWLVLGLIANMVYPYLKGREMIPSVPMDLGNSHG